MSGKQGVSLKVSPELELKTLRILVEFELSKNMTKKKQSCLATVTNTSKQMTSYVYYVKLDLERYFLRPEIVTLSTTSEKKYH